MAKRSVLGSLLELSAPESRRPAAALAAGLIAGVTSGFIKIGWENLLPPRVEGREPPPVTLLKNQGVDFENKTFTFSGNQVPWAVFSVHFGFSVAAVTAYAVLAEYLPKTKLALGMVYGTGVWAVFHLGVLPALKLSPGAKDLPRDEQISEFFGHLVWILEAEFIRRDVRQRIAGVPDADTRSAGAAALLRTAKDALRR